MASGDAVERIKERLSIVDVVSSYVELQQAGKNYKGKSPFTTEKTPSFYVSPDRGMYYCFSSSQGGDIFTFIEKMEGVDFKEALRILAEKAGVELVAEDPKKKSERDRLYDALEEATKFFETYKHTNEEVLPYLKDRGVNPETIARWRIGYAPGPSKYGWRELKEHLEGKGFKKEELLKAGLIKNADQGKEPYDLFRDRVMFPICDQSGRVVAFSGRILTKDTEAPKYVNSPETELFNKSEILFGYDKAKNGIRHLDFSLVVEGQFDVVLSHQAGYTNAVAVSGTALTPYHVMLLQRLSNRVVLALDADRAGIAAVKRAATIMLPRGIDIKVANMVGGKDPADMVREDVTKLRKIIGGAKPVVEYLLDILEVEKKDDRNLKLQVRAEVLPLVSLIQNRIDQDHFEGVIAERLSTTKEAIHYEVEHFIESQKEKSVKAPHVVEEKIIPPTSVQKQGRKHELVQYLALFATLVGGRKKELIDGALTDLLGKSSEDIEKEIPVEVKSGLIFTLESYLTDMPQKHIAEELADKCNELKKAFAKEEIITLREKIALAESEGDEESVLKHMEEMASLQKKAQEGKYETAQFL
jgi:DNA primase